MNSATRVNKVALAFILLSFASLLAGAFFGCVAALQFVYPAFARFLPFVSNRPLHVSLVLAWIFFSAIGGIYYYLPALSRGFWKTSQMQRVQLVVCVLTGLGILACYVLGIFGGREYWEYPPVFSLFIVAAWIVFGVNFFVSTGNVRGPWPAYVWMWATGIVFFLLSFSEANLWLIPAIRNDPVRDITVQWKAYGTLIGSWNMLVYGTALFLMDRISGNERLARSKSAFLLYLIGFVNLLFGWAHHIYIVPVNPWIRNVSYVVSMSEWILFFGIIYNWRRTVETARKHLWLYPYRFLMASDVWILLNIVLALLISIPAINLFTHGTHITVAHAMGSTIGINTMILLASCSYIVYEAAHGSAYVKPAKSELWGWVTLNASLLVFCVLLVVAGIAKGSLVARAVPFDRTMAAIAPFMTLFAYSGIGIFAGLCLILAPLTRTLLQILATPEPEELSTLSS